MTNELNNYLIDICIIEVVTGAVRSLSLNSKFSCYLKSIVYLLVLIHVLCDGQLYTNYF